MIYTRDELLRLKDQFTEKPMHFENIHKIFSKTQENTTSWKPNSVIISEHDKIKKNSFNILNKLSLDNFSKLSQSLIELLKQTTDEMVKLFIKQMIYKCIQETRYNYLYVELYDCLQKELLYFHEYFLETLQECYENEQDKTNRLGLLSLIMNLYKKGIIKEYIIHHCLKEYFEKNMFEEICILFTECGKLLDHKRAKPYNYKNYFKMLETESMNKKKWYAHLF